MRVEPIRLVAASGSPFTPLDTAGTTNDNLYFSGTAGHIYNVGSGLGYPDFAKLAGDFSKGEALLIDQAAGPPY